MFSKLTLAIAKENLKQSPPFDPRYRKMCEELLLDRGDFYERDFYCLSNFSSFKLMWKGLTFDTSEHAYHWEKFNLDTAWHIHIKNTIHLGTMSAHQAFKLANQVRDRRRPDWDDATSNGRPVKVNIMKSILRAKLEQHEYVHQKLRQAYYNGLNLTERSWRDSFWGCGEDGEGEDWMGGLWTEIAKEAFR